MDYLLNLYTTDTETTAINGGLYVTVYISRPQKRVAKDRICNTTENKYKKSLTKAHTNKCQFIGFASVPPFH